MHFLEKLAWLKKSDIFSILLLLLSSLTKDSKPELEAYLFKCSWLTEFWKSHSAAHRGRSSKVKWLHIATYYVAISVYIRISGYPNIRIYPCDFRIWYPVPKVRITGFRIFWTKMLSVSLITMHLYVITYEVG